MRGSRAGLETAQFGLPFMVKVRRLTGVKNASKTIRCGGRGTGMVNVDGSGHESRGGKMKLRIRGITKGWGKRICNMVRDLG